MSENEIIKLYALTTCNHCRAVMDLLESQEVTFDYVYVDLLKGAQRRDMLEEIRKLNKRCSFPTLRIGQIVVVGFREGEILEVLKSWIKPKSCMKI